jgi:hypothetical protein
MREDVDRQLPNDGEVFLDHVGHFVADPEAAAADLARAGFFTTPRSIQVNPDGRGGETLTGTGNTTAMFRRGYIEILFKTADTPLGRELDIALARYPGVHLAAFAVSDAQAAHARLQAAGFRVRPLAAMQRPVETADGRDIAAFTVARVEPGEMAEGRVQILTHRTESTVWQPRWLTHPNGTIALADLVIASHDIAEASARFSRFLDRPPDRTGAGWTLRLDRGRVQLVTPEMLRAWVPHLSIPALPFIAAYGLVVTSLDRLEAVLRDGGLAFVRHRAAIVAPYPNSLGQGTWLFVENPADLPWRVA